jgi:hypothetical protein
LQHLSIVQDPLDPVISSQQNFAQPIVFFRLDPISTLVRSEYLRSLTTFQLRIPMRQVGRYIAELRGPVHQSVKILDLSTCNIYEADLDSLLMRFTGLRHLILDGCGIIRGEFSESDWANLGRMCAMVGMKQARIRERKLKAWLESQMGDDEGGDDANNHTGEQPRLGVRQGLLEAMNTLSLGSQSTQGNRQRGEAEKKSQIPRVRILPNGPSLHSLAVVPSMLVELEEYPAVREAFRKGWDAGLLQVNRLRSQLRTSWRNGVRILHFDDSYNESEEAFSGLTELGDDDFSWFGPDGSKCPALCLVGPDDASGEGHISGCGHVAMKEGSEEEP